MLKRSVAIVLTILYVCTVFGFVLNFHYCFDRLSSVKVDAPAIACTKILQTSKMKCCKDRHIEVKVKDAHQSSSPLFWGKLFPLGLPKLLKRLRGHVYHSGRLALFGIRRALHRKAVGGVVILAFIEEMRRRGLNYDVKHLEFGWVLEQNMGMRRPIEMGGAQVDKIHRIYEKDLSA